MCKNPPQNPQYIIQKSNLYSQEKRMQQKNIFIHQRNSLPRKDSCFSPDAAVSEYTKLSIRPSMSTSPLSRVSRFTCSSFPRIISIPCSVSSRISRRSKESTSLTPFTVQVRLLVIIILCISVWGFERYRINQLIDEAKHTKMKTYTAEEYKEKIAKEKQEK